MGQLVYRGNLSAKAFPFLTDFHGQSVIVGGQDNTFNRSLTSPEDTDKDVGIPVAYYMHNMLPSGYGFNSIGYTTLLTEAIPNVSTFSEVKTLRANNLSPTAQGPVFYFSPMQDGYHYIYVLGAVTWLRIAAPVGYVATTKISYATVQGISYIYFSNIGCYKYNSATNTLTPVTLTGLVPANILGIVGYQSYLIAYDTVNVYWSSILDIDYTTNSIDFTPSLLTNASNLKVDGLRSNITFVVPATFGITVYTSVNIVTGMYSGNPRYPFSFKEVVSSGGCSDSHYVSYDSNTGNQYSYTSSGFQVVTAAQTQTTFPELTDFLSGQDFEDFDENTLTFTKTALTLPMVKKVTAVSDRYLVISYGITSLTHAIIYDMVQQRYGKLKIPHVDCFEYTYLDPALSDAPRRSMAFLQANGTVKIVNSSLTLVGSKGVLILGKFQYVRSRLMTLQSLTFQTVKPYQSIMAYDFASVIGGTTESQSVVQGYDASVNNQPQKTFNFNTTALNHSICLIGGFFVSSFKLTFFNQGRR